MSEAEGGQRAEKKDKGKKKTGAASQNGVVIISGAIKGGN